MPDRPDHTRSAIEDRGQEQRRATGTRRYTLTLEVSPDDVVGGYTATEASYEPGGMVGRGASPREAIADWIREAENAGHDPEDGFREVPHG